MDCLFVGSVEKTLVYFCVAMFIINNSTVEDNSLISMTVGHSTAPLSLLVPNTPTRRTNAETDEVCIHFYPGSST